MQLQQGREEQNVPLLQLMASVHKVPWCDFNCNRNTFCLWVCCSSSCDFQAINCNRNKYCYSSTGCSCDQTVWEKKSPNLFSKPFLKNGKNKFLENAKITEKIFFMVSTQKSALYLWLRALIRLEGIWYKKIRFGYVRSNFNTTNKLNLIRKEKKM